MIRFVNTPSANVPTPPADRTTVFVSDTGVPSYKDSSGTTTSLQGTDGQGVPTGGTTGQVLRKTSGADYATAWQTLTASDVGAVPVPSGIAADQSTYYDGSNFLSYTLTSVGRTFLAASTQATQRAAIQAVGLVGADTVAGIKTYTDNGVWIVNADGSRIITQSFGANPTISFYKGDFDAGTATRSMFIGAANQFRVGASATMNNAAPTTFIDFLSNQVRPSADNIFTMGTASLRFTTYYGVNAAINTSDSRLKTQPRDLKESEFLAASSIVRLPGVWRWLHRVNGDNTCEPEGRNARKHFGPTVQAVISVMESSGLDPFEYSFICYDKWEAQEATYDDDGNELTSAIEAGDRYSFRKEEMLCFIVRALAQEIDVLNNKVESLDARLAALENK